MKKVFLAIIILSLIVWISIKVNLPVFLYNKVNSITDSGPSFTTFINKKHYLVKSIAIDTTAKKNKRMIELEKFLNYQSTAGQTLRKVLK